MSLPRPYRSVGERRVTLRDGRRLALAEYGDPAGRPAFYFHGFPGSRIEGSLTAQAAARSGVRVLAVDRPGYGLSDDRPGRELLDWPDDVAELADRLGLERFAVVGASGGGPYVAACAFAIPERIEVAGIVAGLGPTDDPEALAGMLGVHRAGVRLARRVPWAPFPVFATLGPVVRRWPELVVRRLIAATAPPDRQALARPDLGPVFVETFREAFRSGPNGAARDARIYSRPWGFRPEDVSLRVHLWHGEQDYVVPASMSRMMARRLPDCSATFFPDEGHFSIAVRRTAEIMDALVGRAEPWAGAPLGITAAGEYHGRDMRETIRRFLEGRRFAVVGASNDRAKYGNKVLRCYVQHGRTAYPVNPRATTVEGLACYPDLRSLPGTVDGISVITPPAATERIVEDAPASGAGFIWMQPGAESAAAVRRAEELGLEVIAGGPCLLVALGFRDD